MTTAMIDLRSDTVTRPDAAMRAAMASAEVGDDVYGEDPTVRRLEDAAAAAVGMAAALFVPSGTMGNQIALHLHGRAAGVGAEVICEAQSHVFHYEMGAMAALSGLLPRPVAGERGLLDAEAVAAAIAPDVPYRSRTALLTVENTHNLAGGSVYHPQRLAALLTVARRHRLPTHLDGARVFNAAVRLDVPVAALTAGFDSVTFCLSKGLGAPVGSMLCGSVDFVREAWRVRKMLGGGMRQVGILAAAGLLALRDGPARLADDHANAAWLAGELATIPGLAVDPTTVETNIVFVRLTGALATPPADGGSAANALLARLRSAGVLAGAMGPAVVRFVTHRDVDRQGVERAATAVRAAAAGQAVA
jgi:threonine aldolase